MIVNFGDMYHIWRLGQSYLHWLLTSQANMEVAEPKREWLTVLMVLTRLIDITVLATLLTKLT